LNAHDRLSAFTAVDRFLRYLGVERQLSPITLLNYRVSLMR
jgi:integrase/recombinase XerC